MDIVSADKLPGQPILGGGTVREGGRRKLLALDGIRGLAVLAVMLSHFERFLPANTILTPMKSVMAFGWCGVDLFFVLSGFLITGILMETRTALNYFVSFYIRRVLRIFPLYYAALIAVFIIAAVVPSIPNVPPMDQRWLYFAYIDNWLPIWTHSWPPNVVGHFWSLAVEEQFYLVWPLVVLVCTPRRLFRLAVGLSVLALAIRCMWVAHSGWSEAVMLGTATRMDSLLIGAITAMMFAGSAGARPPRALNFICGLALGGATLGIILTAWNNNPEGSFNFVATVGYSLLALGFGALVLGAALSDGGGGLVQRAFRTPLLTRVGRYSYGMYVYHVPLLGICELLILRHLPASVTENPWFAIGYVLFLTIATFVIAAVSFELVESRILALKRFAEPLFSVRDPIVSG